MKIRISILGFLLAVAAVTADSKATTINFSNLNTGSCASDGPSVTSGGYNFSGNPADSSMFMCNAGVVANNTTPALINANATSEIFMSAVGNAVFSLNSFSAGNRDDSPSNYGTTTAIALTGYLSGGGTVTETISLSGNLFSNFLVNANFINLTSASFIAIGTPGYEASGEFVINNIAVNGAVVPEPASIALFGAALFGLGIARRRALR